MTASLSPFTEEEAATVRRFGFDVKPPVSELGAGAIEGLMRDARDDWHVECDCVPDLGPSHCHACGEAEDVVVAWWRALELHAISGVRS